MYLKISVCVVVTHFTNHPQTFARISMIEIFKISLSMIIAGVSLAVIIKKKESECPA